MSKPTLLTDYLIEDSCVSDIALKTRDKGIRSFPLSSLNIAKW
jgi:hypothetical protein